MACVPAGAHGSTRVRNGRCVGIRTLFLVVCTLGTLWLSEVPSNLSTLEDLGVF